MRAGCSIQRSTIFCSSLLALLALIGCGKSTAKTAETPADAAQQPSADAPATNTAAAAKPVPDLPKPIDPMVVLHTSQGDVTIKLFQEKAPRTVENFLRGYAERGFYEQTIFHHVEPGQMIIAGGYTADLQRKPPRAPIYNESKNGLLNRRGTIAMIRDADAPHSATSEFFINLADNPDFDFKATDEDDVPGYCVFGEVVQGMDVIDRIAQLPTASLGDFAKVPSPPVTIARIERLQ
ncbi:MAG TPA: peptidylprolyl isomerase [Pirellulaceae bacterium]|jgi:cyclophilin family peptidyl-prolyl cis-trans isomerase